MTASSVQSNESCTPENTFDLTLYLPPTTLNPLTSLAGTGYIWELEYPGATDYLSNGSEVSYLLSNWSHNANYTEWTLNIKPGLKWSNGQPVTSQDLLTSEGSTFAFNSSYDYLGLGREIANEYAINSSAAVFILNDSNAHFVDELSADGQHGTPVLPASVIDEFGADYPNLGTDVSMGPFYVSNYNVGTSSLIMYRNPYFTPEPSICEIDVSYVERLTLTTSVLEARMTDLAPIDPFDVAAIDKIPNLGAFIEKNSGTATLEYNDSIYPYDQLAFRQALVYGINQTAFIQAAYDGYASTAYSSEAGTPPDDGYWYNPNLVQYSYDPSKAESLLAGIGITKGANGLLHYANGTQVVLTLWTDVDGTEDAAGAQVVQTNLEQLGFQVNLVVTTSYNIEGDYGANSNGIRSDLILFTDYGINPANPLVIALPACDTEWLPDDCSTNFLFPSSAQLEYQSNFSSFTSTSNQSLEHNYLFNIQYLESYYLPTTVLAYPDFVWGYSNAHWINWPNSSSGRIDEGPPEVPNLTMWETLTPVQGSPSRPVMFGSSLFFVSLDIAGIVAVGLCVVLLFLYYRKRHTGEVATSC